MSIHSFFSLLGGLALFLYGMQMMSTNLEAAAGSRMKQILERLTANRFLGVFVGAGITAIIQSSSATTVMVVGFVNSHLMTLKQAVWIIMGANIGTTVTGQLIALDIGAIAPLIAFAGVALILFVKQKKVQFAGGIIAGLGILFLGMGMMSAAMIPLRDSQHFVNLMTKFSNPFLGILAGAAFTAIIQSSSASVGILQALAVSGLIGLDSAVFVLFGQNIGTCITAVLASIGANRDAKRTTLIHLIFNVIGTTVFTLICLVSPFTQWMASFTPDNPAAQIANVHTLFNIVTTLLLLPFGTQLARISEKLLPDKPQKTTDEERWFEDLLASEHVLGVSVIARKQLNEDISRMLALAASNVETRKMHRDITPLPHNKHKGMPTSVFPFLIKSPASGGNGEIMNSGMIRRIDDLGRIVIPKEIRKNLHIQDGEPLEINVMDRSIMLTPYSPLPALSIQSDLFLRVMAKELKTGTAICSSTAILSYRNVSLYRDCSLSDEIRSRIQSQQQYEYDPEKPIYLETAHICPVNALYLIGTPAKPIGAVVLIRKNDIDLLPEQKSIARIAAQILTELTKD